MALVALAVAIPLVGLLVLTVGAFAGFFAFTRRNLNTTATHLARGTALAVMQTQTVDAWTDTPTLPATSSPTPLSTLVPGEMGKLYNGLQLLGVLLDDNRLVQVPAGETWFIAVNHRGFGANADIHLDVGTQLQLLSVTDARVQVRLLEGSQVFMLSGPYPNGAELELAGQPVVAMVRGCLGVEYTNRGTLTALCFQGSCALSTDFGVTSEEVPAGQSVTMDVDRLVANPARPILAANALPYWNLLAATGAGRDDARQCDVPLPPLPTSTTRPERGPGPAPATNTSAPLPSATEPPPNTPVPQDTPVPPPTSETPAT